MSNLSELHDCKKCQGKIVAISVDPLGVTRCSYCNEIVDYMSWFRKDMLKKIAGFIKENRSKLPENIEVFIGNHQENYEIVCIADTFFSHADNKKESHDIFSFVWEVRNKYPMLNINISIQKDKEHIWPEIEYTKIEK